MFLSFPLLRSWIIFSLIFSAFCMVSCGGSRKMLVVKSDPADAEVCIKGKGGSEYFSNTKSCVGTTPFEADKVSVVTADGERKTIAFSDVAGDQESFYILVSRPGYVPQALVVPQWDHTVVLKPEGQAMAAPLAAVAQHAQVDGKSVLKVTSEPVGALVYIDGVLKGNTPISYETNATAVKLKLELAGHEEIEKALTLDVGQPLNLNFRMLPAEQVEGGRVPSRVKER